MNTRRFGILAMFFTMIAGCGGGGGGGGGSTPATPTPVSPTPTPTPPTPPTPPSNAGAFAVISDARWDNTAVRQVLHTFAFGGRASDAQITTWADMSATLAIQEMLTLDPQHDKLSPPDNSVGNLSVHVASLESVRAYWASDAPDNPIPPDAREFFDDTGPNMRIAGALTWVLGATKYGVNPVRHRIGLFETNYHMAVHYDLGNINDRQMIRYYDDIVQMLANDADYEDVLTHAALSAAIATQYGHFENIYVNGQFSGNEDFGREYHQLFFGILGDYNPEVHESVTIKNTAQALSGIRVPFSPVTGLSQQASYDAKLHNPNDLDILGVSISGADAAEKFAQLSDVAINHPESLANLPVTIIRELADDNLSSEEIDAIRAAWAAMQNKNLMRFLQAYAISPWFHSASRSKRLSSFERHFLVQNRMILNNLESYLDIYGVYRFTEEEGVQMFRPANNVFGGQRGVEAAASSEIFRSWYNRSTENWFQFATPERDLDGGGTWEKDWRTALPTQSGNVWSVRFVAEWLWQRFIADGLAQFGTLERSQVYALLATGHNFAWAHSSGQDPDRQFTESELTTDPLVSATIQQLADASVDLASNDTDTRRFANALIGQAVNFIVATPYAFVLQGQD